MKKIIGKIKPFQLNQTLIVFENGNKIDIVETTLDSLNKDVFSLMNKHQCNRLDLAGPKKFMLGLASEIRKAKPDSQYSLEEDLEINII